MLVDTHAHLMDAAFDPDRRETVDRALRAGVGAIVVVGYDLRSSQAAVELARGSAFLAAAVGIHPNSAGEHSPADFDALAALAREPEVAAIGETGLDYYRDFTPRARQRDALDWHLQLAQERALPVIVHNRQADDDVADALTGARRQGVPGVLHCFSSTGARYLERMLAAGYFVSFAGPLTYKSAADLRGVAAQVPLDRVLVETDCPYLAPTPHRGERNEPAFVVDTARELARVLGVALEELAQRVWDNSLRVFPTFTRLTGEVASAW
jgi:TatD DNase family protein